MFKKRKNRVVSDSDDSKSGNSDSEEVSTHKKMKLSGVPTKPSTTTQNTSDSDTSDDDVEWTMDKRQKKKLKKPKSKSLKGSSSKDKVFSGFSSEDETETRHKSKSNRSPEDGELSSSSDSAKNEATGSDEDSEFDEEELRKEFDDGYDAELVGDDEDRQRLQNMTEKEREQELYNRLEKREALEKRFEIEKKLRLAKIKVREEKYQKKKKLNRKSLSSPLSGKATSRNERRRKMEEKKGNKTLEDFKAERERKKNRAAEINKKQILKTCDVYTDDENDEEDEDDKVLISKNRKAGRVSDSDSSDSSANSAQSSSSPSSSTDAKNLVIETKEQLNKVRLSRDELGKWVHFPAFKTLVVGSFVRVGIGNYESKPVYRVGEVVDVCETKKVYSINRVKTNIGLRLKHGRQERVFRIEFVSNNGFTDSEFRKWKTAVGAAGLSLPLMENVKKKRSYIEKHRAQKIDDNAIDHMVKQNSRFRENPYNYAMRKMKLLKDKTIAETSNDTATAKQVADELAKLEQRAEILDKKRQQNIAGITYINERIKNDNLKKEKACLDEFRLRQQSVADPFTRRRCQPVIVTNTGDGSHIERLMQVMEKRYGDGEAKLNGDKSEESGNKNSNKNQKEKEKAKDLFEAHDFDIKLDLKVPSSAEPSLQAAKASLPPSSSESTSRRSLNLSDYKKRRGLI